MEKILTSQNFDAELAAAGKPMLVDFWATWCGPCKRQAPILAELAEEGYAIGKVDVDENPDLAQKFGVMSIPTMIIFKDGKEEKRLVGLTAKDVLKEMLA
ncbi:MAG: thioredoxin [Blautia sp.]|nr:thioredoxin [Blautia sp.]